ncbi:Uncharacterised protein [Escherichia coli]|nr:Uncharacterised protein [Escherichia coli]
MLGGADNPNGELPSYITGADTDSGEVTAMQFDTILWEVHASPPQRSNAGCKISQVHFCICEWRREVGLYVRINVPV